MRTYMKYLTVLFVEPSNYRNPENEPNAAEKERLSRAMQRLNLAMVTGGPTALISPKEHEAAMGAAQYLNEHFSWAVTENVVDLYQLSARLLPHWKKDRLIESMLCVVESIPKSFRPRDFTVELAHIWNQYSHLFGMPHAGTRLSEVGGNTKDAALFVSFEQHHILWYDNIGEPFPTSIGAAGAMFSAT
jgi:hypothetical protein